jgi:hypothetical protein
MSSDVSVALREDQATLEISSHYESFLNNATAIRDRVKNNQDILRGA